jgi:hypothetical protein
MVRLRKRLEAKLVYFVLAFAVCTLANLAIQQVGTYLIPVDVAGTPPPDPRNAWLRLIITAAVQLPVSVLLAYFIGATARVDRPPEP